MWVLICWPVAPERKVTGTKVMDHIIVETRGRKSEGELCWMMLV